jgi:FkbM family methyltransferase
MIYYSQLGQDKFIDDFFSSKENGIFLDIGAHDGESGSNTYFLEKFRNWKGICIEPGIEEFKILKNKRKSININACVSNYDGVSEFTYIEGYSNMLSGLTETYNDSHRNRIAREVDYYGGKISKIQMPVYKLQTILDKENLFEIDYCSLDTEGSEFKILQSINFDKTNIKIFSIENNYNDIEIVNFLLEKGYKLYTKLQWDDIFIKL